MTIGNNVGLNLSPVGGFVPSVSQTFTIISNDGAGPGDHSGEFLGLPDGGVITNFLGSGLNAIITYSASQGNDGNDVVLRVVSPNQPPTANAAPQEVTYHGVEMVYPNVVLAANEGRSYLDAVDVKAGKLLDRLMDVSKPCCVERIPGTDGRVLLSNIGDGTLQLVEVSREGRLKSLGKAQVGAAPKRVAFVPPSAGK